MIPPKNFELLETRHLPDGTTHLYILRHRIWSSRILCIQTLDQENAFGVSFRTLPTNSHGTPHILEHLILAGTDRYPGVDPFFGIARRGLSTFLNAFTGQKFTCYPAASCIQKDLANIFEVYFHSLFAPSLAPLALAQEGFRYEYSSSADSTTPLIPSGIVYNEMLGVWSQAEERLQVYLRELLFPNTPYAFSAGGIPQDVMEISHAEILEFYHRYYHPSLAHFYFCGSLDLTQQLQQLDDLLETLPEKWKSLSSLPAPLPLNLPPLPDASAQRFYPITADEGDPLSYLAIGLLGPLAWDSAETISLEILLQFLAGHDASPLKAAILSAELCDDFEFDLDTENDHLLTIALFDNPEKNSTQALIELYKNTLEKILAAPIPTQALLDAAHQYRLTNTERNEEGYPYAIKILMRVLPHILEGNGQIDALASLVEIHDLIDQVISHLLVEDNFRAQLKRYFISPLRQGTLLLTPSTQITAEEQNQLEKKLQEQSPTGEIKQERIDTSLALRNKPNLQSNYDLLPSLKKEEIPTDELSFPLTLTSKDQSHYYCHLTQSQQIGYLSLTAELPLNTALTMLPWLRLLTDLLSEIDTKLPYNSLLKQIERYTGGIEASINLETPLDTGLPPKIYLALDGKSFEKNASYLFELMLDIWSNSHFKNSKRLATLLQQYRTQEIEELKNHPLHYATLLSGANLSLSGWIENELFGLPYYHWLLDITSTWSKKKELYLAQLERAVTFMQSILPSAVASGETPFLEELTSKNILSGISTSPYPLVNAPLPILTPPKPIILHPIADKVGAAAARLYLPSALHIRHYPALKVLGNYWEEHHLHPQIREQGSAYGSGISLSLSSPGLSFYSYRDPTPQRSIDIFKKTWELFGAGDLPNEEIIYEATLGVMRERDRPVSPGNRAKVAFSYIQRGITLPFRQKLRQEILSLNAEKLRHHAEELADYIPSWNSVCFLYLPCDTIS